MSVWYQTYTFYGRQRKYWIPIDKIHVYAIDDTDDDTHSPPRDHDSIVLFNVNKIDIIDMIASLNTKKATWCDEWSYHMVKKTAQVLFEPLFIFLQYGFDLLYLPCKMEALYVAWVFKKGNSKI